eukprot:490537-Amphidinium_carterae.1
MAEHSVAACSGEHSVLAVVAAVGSGRMDFIDEDDCVEVQATDARGSAAELSGDEHPPTSVVHSSDEDVPTPVVTDPKLSQDAQH